MIPFPERCRLRGLASLCAVCFLFLFLFLPSAPAVEPFDIDSALLRELNKLEMFEYSRLQLILLEERYPDKRGHVLLEKARTLYLAGKSKLADEVLAAIQPDSPVYEQALLLGGEAAARRKKFDQAEKAYSRFFKNVKPPSGRRRSEVETYKRAIAVYSHVLRQQGKAEEASRIIGLLANIKGEGATGDRQLAFLKNQAVLDAEEGKLAERVAVDRDAVVATLNKLRDLQFMRDGVAAAAYVESARAHVILGGDSLITLKKAGKDDEIAKVEDFLEAIKFLKMAAPFLEEIEHVVVKGRDKSSSPLAGAMFYKGRALWGQALVAASARNMEQTRKLVRAAAKYFELVAADYGDSPYRMKALNEHSKCGAYLERKFGETLKLTQVNVEAELELKLEQAGAMVQNENYAGAAESYLEGVRVARLSKRLPEVAMRLIVCYGRLERFLEAEALASYLTDLLPTSEQTAESLFRLGAVLYERAKKERPGPTRDDFTARAMSVWETFVDLAPVHPKAPDVSFIIAEHHYRTAADLAKKAAKTRTAKEAETLKAAAREAYLAAVPEYLRLTERYGSYTVGTRALYKLGWIYYSTDQPDEAVEAFLRYCEAETQPKHNDDRLEAKFRAAEQLMLGSSPAEAEAHFRELLGWLEKDNDRGFDVNTRIAKRIREDATSYLGWSLDLAGEKNRPRLTEGRQAITQQEREIKQAEGRIAANQELLNELEQSREKMDADFSDLERIYGKVDLDFAKAAEEQARKLAEDMTDMTAEEKTKAEQNLRTRAATLRTELLEGAEKELIGERLTREAERENLKAARKQAEERLAELSETLRREEAEETRLKARKKELAGKLQDLLDKLAAAEKAVVEGEAERQDLAEKAERLKEYRERAKTRQQREAVAKKQKELGTLLARTRAKLTEAHEIRNSLLTPETQQKQKELEEALAGAGAELKERTARVLNLKQAKAVAGKEAERLTAELQATAKALDFNRAMGKVLQTPLEEREARLENLREKGLQALEAFRKAKDLRIEKAVIRQNIARNAIATDKEAISQARRTIADIERDMAPVKAAFTGWKQRAEKQFREFLNTYPKSKHVPANMARLGTIYLELEQFDKASATLKKLAEDYPDSPAAEQALFNLGRAQCENGNYEEAGATFAQLLKDPAGVTAANLDFVSERMLEAGYPAVSLLASKELVVRSADRGREDYETLRERVRESALFRAGRASRLEKDPDGALVFFAKLLDENPNSAFYFETKFEVALCKRTTTPPDLEGAVVDLSEVLQYSDSQTVSNRALARLGETLAMSKERKDLERAVARLQQVVLLADPTVPANQPWIELALYGSAKAFARLGETAQRDKMVKLYARQFPKGRYRDALAKLPEPEFSPASTPAPAE